MTTLAKGPATNKLIEASLPSLVHGIVAAMRPALDHDELAEHEQFEGATAIDTLHSVLAFVIAARLGRRG